MATTSTPGARSMSALSDWRPIRPNPLMPTLLAIASTPSATVGRVLSGGPRAACRLSFCARCSQAPVSAGRADATSGTVPTSPTSSPRAACTTFARAAWDPERGRGDRLSGWSDQPLPPGDGDPAAQDHRVWAEDVHDGDHRDGHGAPRTLDYDACDRISQVRGPRDIGGGERSGRDLVGDAPQDRSRLGRIERVASGVRDARAGGQGLEMTTRAATAQRPVHVDRQVPELAGDPIGAGQQTTAGQDRRRRCRSRS